MIFGSFSGAILTSWIFCPFIWSLVCLIARSYILWSPGLQESRVVAILTTSWSPSGIGTTGVVAVSIFWIMNLLARLVVAILILWTFLVRLVIGCDLDILNLLVLSFSSSPILKDSDSKYWCIHWLSNGEGRIFKREKYLHLHSVIWSVYLIFFRLVVAILTSWFFAHLFDL